MVSDEDVIKAISDLEYLLNTLAEINNNLSNMYILHYTTGTNKENSHVLLQTEVVFGSRTTKFTTMFDAKATKSLIEALSMSLAMVNAGDKLSIVEGNA